jgi:hypothetical protein
MSRVAPAGGPTIEAGHRVAEVAETPIVVRGQRLGALRVGHHHRGERFAAEESAALTEVAARIGMVLQNAALTWFRICSAAESVPSPGGRTSAGGCARTCTTG